MDSVLKLTPKQRSELFIAAAQQSGIDVVGAGKGLLGLLDFEGIVRFAEDGWTFDF